VVVVVYDVASINNLPDYMGYGGQTWIGRRLTPSGILLAMNARESSEKAKKLLGERTTAISTAV
jgi:hypothetical protein